MLVAGCSPAEEVHHTLDVDESNQSAVSQSPSPSPDDSPRAVRAHPGSSSPCSRAARTRERPRARLHRGYTYHHPRVCNRRGGEGAGGWHATRRPIACRRLHRPALAERPTLFATLPRAPPPPPPPPAPAPAPLLSCSVRVFLKDL